MRAAPSSRVAWSVIKRSGRQIKSARENNARTTHQQHLQLTAKAGGKMKFNQSCLRKLPTKNDGLRSAIDQIAHLHPANDHLNDKAIPQAQRAVVAEAVARDGVDLVLSGTRSLAEGVAQWEPADRRFIPHPVRVYQEARDLKRPET